MVVISSKCSSSRSRGSDTSGGSSSGSSGGSSSGSSGMNSARIRKIGCNRALPLQSQHKFS